MWLSNSNATATEGLLWWPVWNLGPVCGLCQCPLTLGRVVVNVGAYFAERKLGFQGSKENFTVWPSRNPYGSIREERSKKWVKGQVIHASTLTVSALVWGSLLQLRKSSLNHTAERDEKKFCRHSFQSKSLFSEFPVLQPSLWMEGTISGRVTE